MEKTIKEWFETLPEPHRTKAFKNTTGWKLDQVTSSLESTIWNAFIWCNSPEGTNY